MATVRDYFDTDLKALTISSDWPASDHKGVQLPPATAKLCCMVDANAKYLAFYIPEGANVEAYAANILESPHTAQCDILGLPISHTVEVKWDSYVERTLTESLVFTKRIYLYVNNVVASELKSRITLAGMQRRFSVMIRDRKYAAMRSKTEKPLVFICHDSRDKDPLVRDLASEISKLMCPVWYDEFSLGVGDSLRASIEKGLKEARKCIVVLSPNFFSNKGWGRAEFDSIFTREILEESNVILPIWHNVERSDVYQYCPRLADKVGLKSSLRIEELARKLVTAIKYQGT